MRRGKVLAFFVSVALAYASSAHAKKPDLLKEVASLTDSTMTIEEYGVLTLHGENQLRIRFSAEAPREGLASRDKFVALSAQIQHMLFLDVALKSSKSQARSLSALASYQHAVSLTGKADLAYRVYMRGPGVRIELLDARTGEAQQLMLTWEEFFREGVELPQANMSTRGSLQRVNNGMARALQRQKAMLALLEQHKDDPEGAALAVERYVTTNLAEFDELVAIAGEVKDFEPEVLDWMLEVNAEAINEVGKRTKALIEQHPALFRDRRVLDALTALGG